MTRTKKEQWAKLLAPIRHGMTDPAKVHFDRARSPYLADYDRIRPLLQATEFPDALILNYDADRLLATLKPLKGN